MAILLTGGTGYIGSHTATALVQAGHEVVLLDNLSNSRQDVVERLRQITGRRLAFHEADVRDRRRVAEVLRAHGCTAVVHFAGLKAVGESVEKPLEYFDNNVGGSLALLQAMQDAGVSSIVFSSSATVYGEPKRLPLDEAHPTSAANPYGRTKLHIEEMLADVCRANPAWRAVCLRYFNPAGAHPSGLIGEDPNGIPNNLMPYIAKVAMGELDSLGVFGSDYPTPDGTGVRDYIHVMDLAEGHAAALSLLQREAGWHAVNLGTGRGYSVLEMLRAFEQACGHPIAHEIKPRRPGDVASCYADPARALSTLGWRANRGIEEMCSSTWRWCSAGRKNDGVSYPRPGKGQY
ncbi:MAG TPA: UDP-glucose 4-epimerase GalE [Ramlibacter sp.]|nr:UDP-glucose 4-epimerase GalE [Ramlibacter sp.]